jgi:outer membrane protein
MRRRLPGAGLAALLSLLGTTGPAPAQTLTQALAEAYQTNPQLLAQRALLRATDEQVPQALANWRPTVNFTGSIGYGAQAQAQRGVQTVYSHTKP